MSNSKMYNLELEKVISEIKKNRAKTVLIQLADGLKPKAREIKAELEKKTHANILFWMNSCYGACDVPNIKGIDVDLIIQFGHSL